MRKSTLQSLVNYLNGEAVTNISDIKAELERELNRNAAKAQANRELYDTARGVVLAQLELAPDGATLGELYASCEGELPEGFTRGKLNYALTHYWEDAVSVEQTKGGNVYRLR